MTLRKTRLIVCMLLSSLLSGVSICAMFLPGYEQGTRIYSERIYNNLKTIKIDLLEDEKIDDPHASTTARRLLKDILSDMYIAKNRLPKSVLKEIDNTKWLRKKTIKQGNQTRYQGYEVLKRLLYYPQEGNNNYQSAQKAGWGYDQLLAVDDSIKMHLARDPTFKKFYHQKDAGKIFAYLLGRYAPPPAKPPIIAKPLQEQAHPKLNRLKQKPEPQEQQQEQTFVEDDLSFIQGVISDLLSGSLLNKTLHQQSAERGSSASRDLSVLAGVCVLIGSTGAYFAGKHLRDRLHKKPRPKQSLSPPRPSPLQMLINRLLSVPAPTLPIQARPICPPKRHIWATPLYKNLHLPDSAITPLQASNPSNRLSFAPQKCHILVVG